MYQNSRPQRRYVACLHPQRRTLTHTHTRKHTRTHRTHRHHFRVLPHRCCRGGFLRQPPGHLAVPRLHLLAWQHRRLLRASQNGRVVSNCACRVCSGTDRETQREAAGCSARRLAEPSASLRGFTRTSHQGQHERCSGIYGVYSLVGPCCACVHVCVLCVCAYVRVCVWQCVHELMCVRCVVVADAKDNEFSKGEKDIEDALELVREHPTLSRLRAAACHALQCSV
jgi:hypothetical protein